MYYVSMTCFGKVNLHLNKKKKKKIRTNLVLGLCAGHRARHPLLSLGAVSFKTINLFGAHIHWNIFSLYTRRCLCACYRIL